MYVVIMAGGSGTRFWPVSRTALPKQFLNIVGDKPMVLATYERIRPLVADERIILVVGEKHRRVTERLFEGLDVRILVEPVGRNTAPCIGLAAKYVQHLGSNEPVVVLPADHYIAAPDSFRKGILNSIELANEGAIVTLGIVPTRPETGYGYIERDPEHERLGAYPVRKFVEKPNIETAKKYLASGNFYWNAGIFVARADTFLEEFRIHLPSFAEGLDRLAADFDTPQFDTALESLYLETEGISFDYAIMEKTSKPVYVIPSECGWSDVGSWYSLYEVRKDIEQDGQGNVKEGDVFLFDCEKSFVLSRAERTMAVLGLKNVLVIDTGDALLVADLERSQEIKSIIDHFKNCGKTDLL